MTARPIAAGPSRRQWILLICIFFLSLPAVTTRIYSSDEIQYFAYLRSAWFDRDLSFENEYQYFYERGIARSEGFHETFLERTTATGRRINFGTIGCAILWTPFYAAGDLAARATGAPRDGFSAPYIASVAYGSAVYGFLAIVLGILSARRLGLDAFGAGVIVWLGTPLLFYMYVAPPFSHATSAFGVALFIYVWIRVRDRWPARGLAALGASAALMAMIREQDAFFAAGPAVDLALSSGFGLLASGFGRAARESHVNARGRSSESPKPKAQSLIVAAAAFGLVFLPQAGAYIVLNGHLGPHASVGHKMNWAAPHALQVLFSPQHGFFVWTPLAAIALAGLVWLVVVPAGAHVLPPRGGSHGTASMLMASDFGRKRHFAIALLLTVALQVYVGGSVESWTVAGAYGQRRFVALTAALVIGCAAAATAIGSRSSVHARRSRGAAAWAFTAIAVLCVYWNLALIAEFAVGLMDRQKLEPVKNARDAFVTLPRQAPRLAYRYLFDRRSFYKGSTVGDRSAR